VTSPTALAFLAGATALLGLAKLGAGTGEALRAGAPRLARGAAGLVEAVARLGREGRDPGAVERRRLLAAGALVAFMTGAAVAGPGLGVALACAGPWAVARVLRSRRLRYSRAVDAGVAQISLSLADAMAGGHSLRGAIAEAARSVDGAAGHALGRAARELDAGTTTEAALAALRERVRSPRLDMLVAACLLQRRAGGDLAGLLRQSARSMEEQARLEDEVRAATAQARFTGLLVILLPVGGGLLTELASPGWFAGLWGSFLTAWLVGIALVLQVVAALLMRRLGAVRL
jgi:tight adherence protein B